jgi:hypothetical protein
VARGFPGGEGEALDVPGQKQVGASGPDAPWWLAVDPDVGMSGVNEDQLHVTLVSRAQSAARWVDHLTDTQIDRRQQRASCGHGRWSLSRIAWAAWTSPSTSTSASASAAT